MIVAPCAVLGMSRDGKILVTGGEDGVVAVWRQRKDGTRGSRRLHLLKSLCGHTNRVSCLSVCQPYSLVVSGSLDRTVIFWDLTSLKFVRQLPKLPAPASAVYTNDMTGEVITAAGTTLAVWSINGDCLAIVSTSQVASDTILSITSQRLSDWMRVSWYVTGQQNGAIKLWHMKSFHSAESEFRRYKRPTASWSSPTKVPKADSEGRIRSGGIGPECQLVLYKLLSWHNEPVTAISLSHDLKQLYSGDAGGHVIAWTLPEEVLKQAVSPREMVSVSGIIILFDRGDCLYPQSFFLSFSETALVFNIQINEFLSDIILLMPFS
jgi:WD40 repeat protein